MSHLALQTRVCCPCEQAVFRREAAMLKPSRVWVGVLCVGQLLCGGSLIG
jgi:hypothetical protein